MKTLDSPRLRLEQYPVSPEVASELLYMAGFEHRDLSRRVVDLGTGTGRLAIGAALLGSGQVLGIDIDKRAIELARENASNADVNVEWVVGDVESVRGEFDVVIMNPPYGTQSPHEDARFLLRAFKLAPVTYSIHKSSTRDFLVKLVIENGRRVDQVRSMEMQIPHLFSFHRKKWSAVEVDLYRITN